MAIRSRWGAGLEDIPAPFSLASGLLTVECQLPCLPWDRGGTPVGFSEISRWLSVPSAVTSFNQGREILALAWLRHWPPLRGA